MTSITHAAPGGLGRTDDTRPALSRGMLAAVAGLSLLAAGIHVKVAPEHFAEWWGYGAFFVAAAIAELALVVLLAVRPADWVLQAGIWGSLATLMMYLVSRTAGIPLGPEAGAVEEVEVLGLVASASEAALLVLLCGLLGERLRSRTLTALAISGALLWGFALTGELTPEASSAGQVHTHHHGAGAEEHGALEPDPHAASAPHDGVLPYIPDSVRNRPRK